ncbi:MAG: hypothetical protein EXR82_06060 [Gammaproteobacteria bacterium]|nr:hypothetical protein [Gammaproteobacteria bacterium]
MHRYFIRVALLLVPLAAGCDQALTVPNTFPEPVVEPLPLDVALYFNDEFTKYRYQENVPGESQWDIELGKANVALFESVSRRLFRSATRVASRPTGPEAAGFNAIIEPSVAAFEFSLPNQSATEQYSVWIRYTVKVFRPDGELLTSWNISAYGESGSTLLRPARSMQQATVLALRDAGAMLTVGFLKEARARGILPTMENVDAPAP